MKIVYFDITRSIEKEECLGVEYRDFDELLKVSDFISIHMPLTEATENMFTMSTISKMKSTSFLINTA